jgi:hypothetical protein
MELEHAGLGRVVGCWMLSELNLDTMQADRLCDDKRSARDCDVIGKSCND